MAKLEFRKNSLKKLEQNDELNARVKVIHPAVWISLIIIVLVLTGYIIWGFLARIEIKVNGVCKVKDNEVTNYIKGEQFKNIKVGQSIKFNGKICQISYINPNPVEVSSSTFSEYLISLGGFIVGEYVYECNASVTIEDGCYMTQTVVDIVAPLPYVFR